MGFALRPTGGGEHEDRAEDLDSSPGVRDHLVACHLALAITDFISDKNRDAQEAAGPVVLGRLLHLIVLGLLRVRPARCCFFVALVLAFLATDLTGAPFGFGCGSACAGSSVASSGPRLMHFL